jgi:hypothetical protein
MGTRRAAEPTHRTAHTKRNETKRNVRKEEVVRTRQQKWRPAAAPAQVYADRQEEEVVVGRSEEHRERERWGERWRVVPPKTPTTESAISLPIPSPGMRVTGISEPRARPLLTPVEREAGGASVPVEVASMRCDPT